MTTEIESPADLPRLIERARAEYPGLWRGLIADWRSPMGGDACWLTYSANYLLRTAGVRWAMDPFSLLTRIGGGAQPDFAEDLESLQLVVFTHAHSDHLDRNLIAAIRHLPITWIVPAFMQAAVLQAADLPPEQVLVPQPGCPIRFGPLTLTPFDGLHFRGGNGVPELGYLAEFNEKRWLFPGDTRCYRLNRLPQFGPLDGVFAHLWLGKGCASQATPPLFDDFVQFFACLQPRRIAVTHLREFGRDPEDIWDLHHYRRVRAEFERIAPTIVSSPALTGQKIEL